ncbi:hypothetical protein LTR05_008055 [Lithohypha guttulata]|uniref:Uncharacterized protein n=1 Tax=Lithohypha guttulata TaxID=1690604 RepID=A0AAN7YD16_9EURO|nr:hypothetical protein LTR05_008055 [Lithohypha guttulata]
MSQTNTIYETLSGNDLPILARPPTLPTHSQDQSRFMQLPAEVRLNILRMGLVSSEGLDVRKQYLIPSMPGPNANAKDGLPQRRTKIVEGYGLVPALLVLCQYLFKEAYPVLYHENTLVLHFQLTEGPSPWSGDIYYCYARALSPSLFRPYDVLGGAGAWRIDPDSASVFYRFQRYRLRLNLNPSILEYYCFKNLIQVLAPFILHKKSVRMKVSTSGNALSSDTRKCFVWELKLLQLVRCQSFQMEIVEASGIGSIVSDVEEVVTSNRGVQDLSKLKANVAPQFSLMEKVAMSDPAHAMLLRHLESAVRDFDVAEFLKHRSNFLDLFNEMLALLNQQISRDDEDILGLEPISHDRVVEEIE